MSAPWKARYGAVFLVMMSNLMLELLLTRIFSATMWYHFAFIAVSVALFGTTVGAVIVQLFPQHFRADRAWHRAAMYALWYALSIVFCTVAQLRFDATFGSTWTQLATLAALYLLIALPFIFSGVFICLALLRAQERLGAVYCADLLGAAIGCAVFVPFMAHGEGPRAVLLLGALAAAGAGLMALSAGQRRTLVSAVAVGLAFLVAFAFRLDGGLLRIRWAKGRADHVHGFERWNAFSRITVDTWIDQPSGWGVGSRFSNAGRHVPQKFLVIDDAAATLLTGFDGNFAAVDHLKWDVTALVHSVRQNGHVLVIGVGGGRDVLTALLFGHHVVGVEVNRDIVGLLQGPFADFTGNLGTRSDVTLVHDEARSYLAHSPQRFDVIQASLVDTWAAAANGAYVLSENALYTKQALHIFLDRLTPDGILSLSRWYFDAQPGETLRLTSLAATVLRERGVRQPREQIYLAHNINPGSSVATLLVANLPFTPGELAALRESCATRGFEEILGPSHATRDTWAALTEPQEPSALLASFPVDLSAPTDDRPFFFNMLRFRDVFRRGRGQTDLIVANAEAVVTLAWLFLIVLGLSLIFIIGPLWLQRSATDHAPRAGWRFLYFASLGVGFILIELSQMQRLMIALGHPVYGLTVVLFSLLIAAGLGSLWSQRAVRRGTAAAFLRRALVLLLLVAVATLAVGSLLARPLEAAPTWVRISGSILLLVPLGFVLGIPMATGLALSDADPPRYRALYWGTNGAASVCGSVLAMMLSLAFGIAATYALGILAYLLAALSASIAFRAASEATVLEPALSRTAAARP